MPGQPEAFRPKSAANIRHTLLQHASNVPESWLERRLVTEEDTASSPQKTSVVTSDSRKSNLKQAQLVNRGRHAAHTAYPDQLPEAALLSGPGDPIRRGEGLELEP